MKHVRTVWMVIGLWLSFAMAVRAQESAGHDAADAGDYCEPTRRDLAWSYLEFERAMKDSPPPAERRPELNRLFDGVTRQFFSGRANEALRALDEATLSLGDGAVAADYAVRSLRAVVTPSVWIRGAGVETPRLEVRSLYDVAAARAVDVDLSIELHHRGILNPVAKFAARGSFGPGRCVSISLPLGAGASEYPDGPYSVMIASPGRPPYRAAWWVVAPESVQGLCEPIEASLRAMVEGGAFGREAAIVRSRLGSVSDHPDESKSVQFLTDPLSLFLQCKRDAESLMQGRSPFKARSGEYWRALDLGGGRVMPMWISAPRTVARGKPMPLVIALHGAGGDESLFIRGYGAGEMTRLSASFGFVLASPSTPIFGSDATILDRLIDDLSIDYPIDRSRVYVVGHSMGGIAAAGLASARSERLAAVACIAGFRALPSAPTPCPVLVISPELDPIISAASIEEAVRASGAGAAIELRGVPGEGHTLVVGPVLRDVVAWLLKHRRAEAAPVIGD